LGSQDQLHHWYPYYGFRCRSEPLTPDKVLAAMNVRKERSTSVMPRATSAFSTFVLLTDGLCWPNFAEETVRALALWRGETLPESADGQGSYEHCHSQEPPISVTADHEFQRAKVNHSRGRDK
jgi:hypothetical protein